MKEHKKENVVMQKLTLLSAFLIAALFLVNSDFRDNKDSQEGFYIGRVTEQPIQEGAFFKPCEDNADCYPHAGGKCKEMGFTTKICVFKDPEGEEFLNYNHLNIPEWIACEGEISDQEYDESGDPVLSCCMKEFESRVTNTQKEAEREERRRRSFVLRNKGRVYDIHTQLCCSLRGIPQTNENGRFNAFCPGTCMPYHTSTQVCCPKIPEDDKDKTRYEVKDLEERLEDIPRDQITFCPDSCQPYHSWEHGGDELCCDGSNPERVPEGSNGCCEGRVLQQGEVCCRSKEKGSLRIKEEVMEGSGAECCRVVDGWTDNNYHEDPQQDPGFRNYYFYEVPLREGEECVFYDEFPQFEREHLDIWSLIIPAQAASIEEAVRSGRELEYLPHTPVSSVPLCIAGLAGYFRVEIELTNPVSVTTLASLGVTGLVEKVPIVKEVFGVVRGIADGILQNRLSPLNTDITVSSANIENADIAIPVPTEMEEDTRLYYCAAMNSCCAFLKKQNIDLTIGQFSVDIRDKETVQDLIGITDVCEVFSEGGVCAPYKDHELMRRVLPQSE